MKFLKRLTITLIFVFMLTFETTQISSGFGLPVGGRVIVYNPACTVGLYINVVTAVPGVGAGT